MVAQNFLFSLLQFVALVAPAIAIMMQVLESTGDSDSPAFRFLETGFMIMVIGGLIIMYKLIQSISDKVLFLGTIFIFGSLMFLATGVAWRAVPGTEEISLSVDSIWSAGSIAVSVIDRVITFSIPPVALIICTYVIGPKTYSLMNIGPIQNLEPLTPSLLIRVVSLIMALRIIIYLARVGYITQYSFRERLSESVSATLIFIIVFPAFVAPIFILFIGAYEVLQPYISFELSSSLFGLPYAWMFFVIFVWFSVELWAEEEGESRLAE